MTGKNFYFIRVRLYSITLDNSFFIAAEAANEPMITAEILILKF